MAAASPTMTQTGQSVPTFRSAQMIALIVGILGLLASAAGWLMNPNVFFPAYLIAVFFWTGVVWGAMAVGMVYYLAGGPWGAVIRTFLEASMRTMWLMAVLFLPIFVGIPYLYIWARPEIVAQSELYHFKVVEIGWLTIPFFIGRSVLYFAIWLILVFALNRLSAKQNQTGDPKIRQSMSRWSAGGMILLILTSTFAAFDWIMSIQPSFVSTAFGAVEGASALIAGFAIIIAVAALLAYREPWRHLWSYKIWMTLGGWLFAFTMLWAYLGYSQFMLIWYGNLPEEIEPFLRRFAGVWEYIILVTVIVSFVVPFIVLLIPNFKLNMRAMAILAIVLAFMRLVNVYWWVAPAYAYDPNTSWLYITAPLGVGGLWVWFFLWQLKRRPLLPLHDPKLPAAPEVEHDD